MGPEAKTELGCRQKTGKVEKKSFGLIDFVKDLLNIVYYTRVKTSWKADIDAQFIKITSINRVSMKNKNAETIKFSTTIW